MVEKAPESESQTAPEEEFVLTPEILRHENKRNDLIIAVGVLLVAFFLGFFKESGPDVWLYLRSGKDIAESFPAVPRSDTYTYTVPGAPWVNPHWLFDWLTYGIYAGLGDKAVVVVKAVVAAATAACLLTIRHGGPTLWGASMFALLAMVAAGRRLGVGPEPVSLLLLGVFLAVVHQALSRQRFGWIYLTVPIAVVWANVELSYFFVPALLLLCALGEIGSLKQSGDAPTAGGRRTSSQVGQLVALSAVTLAAGAATPYAVSGLRLRYSWFHEVLPATPAFDRNAAGWSPYTLTMLLERLADGNITWDRLAWLLLAILALGSAVANVRQFQIMRLFWSLAAIGAALAVDRYIAPSAMVLAVVASLNFQEMYLDRWGTEVRLSKGSLLLSQGGRALTIVVVFVAIVTALTGRFQGIIDRFGPGILRDRYMEAAVEWFEKANPQGNGFAFVDRLAAYRSWATPKLLNFADSRWQVVAPVLGEFSQARQALNNSQPDVWKPIFQKYNVTHVIVDPSDPRLQKPMQTMLDSPDFVPLYIGDQAVVLGWRGAAVDQALFEKMRIQTNEIVFHQERKPPPATDRYVIPPGIIDWLWRSRQRKPLHLAAAAVYSAGAKSLESPGTFYLGLDDLRRALASNPDSSDAYMILGLTYEQIFFKESIAYALDRDKRAEKASADQAATSDRSKDGDKKTDVAAAKPAQAKTEAAKKESDKTASDKPQSSADKSSESSEPTQIAAPSSRYLIPTRHYQIVAALENAVLAGPTTSLPDFKLYSFCRTNNLHDLALYHLERAMAFPISKEDRFALEQEVMPELVKVVEERRKRFDQASEELAKRAGPEVDLTIPKARIALQLDLPRLSAELLDNISPFGQDMLKAAPIAIPLYLMIGQPERADGFLREIRNQRVLQPGEWHWYTAQIRLLSGQYAEACTSLEQALAEIRATRISRILQGTEARLRGPFSTGADPMLSIPVEVEGTIGDMEREALYSFTLGLVRIEAGEPKQAVKSFKSTLTQFGRHGLRPIIEYYWKLMSKEPIPPEPPFVDPNSEIAQKYNLPPMLQAPVDPPQSSTTSEPSAAAPKAEPKAQPPAAPPTATDAAPKK